MKRLILVLAACALAVSSAFAANVSFTSATVTAYAYDDADTPVDEFNSANPGVPSSAFVEANAQSLTAISAWDISDTPGAETAQLFASVRSWYDSASTEKYGICTATFSFELLNPMNVEIKGDATWRYGSPDTTYYKILLTSGSTTLLEEDQEEHATEGNITTAWQDVLAPGSYTLFFGFRLDGVIGTEENWVTTGYSDFALNFSPLATPDGGSTLMLLGSFLGLLGFIRQRLN